MIAQIRIGISGWNYLPWPGVFYPRDLSHRCELEFASRQFNPIEINGSFYSLQRPSSYQRRDLFLYFDNDAKVHAPFDAMRLATLVGK